MAVAARSAVFYRLYAWGVAARASPPSECIGFLKAKNRWTRHVIVKVTMIRTPRARASSPKSNDVVSNGHGDCRIRRSDLCMWVVVWLRV